MHIEMFLAGVDGLKRIKVLEAANSGCFETEPDADAAVMISLYGKRFVEDAAERCVQR